MESLNIRSHSWFKGQLSWAMVTSRLLEAFETMGHNSYFVSTNGIKDNDQYLTEDRMIKSALELQKFGLGKKQIDIDLCYTIPANLPQRFLPNSKNKCVIYNYETWPGWDPRWKKYYHLADYYFPSSNFSAEIFYINGVPKEKIFVIPHGVDRNVFNSKIPPIKLNTKKSYKFVSVVASHHRKNIPLLLNAYCEAFTAKDDVCLVLKTKVYKHSNGIHHETQNPGGRKAFEIIIGDVFKDLYKKFGKDMPEIELLSGHVENVASIYNACDCHVTATGSEGWGMIFLESQACGLLNIAPRYSGQLHFLNDGNALLVDTKLRKAKNVEQYWTYNPKAMIGQPSKKHMIGLMRKVVSEKEQLLKKFKPEMEKTVKRFSWENAAQLIIDATEGNIEHYIPKTYDLKNQHKIR